MFTPIDIGLLISALLFLSLAVVAIRQVRILDRELKLMRKELTKQSTENQMKNQNQPRVQE